MIIVLSWLCIHLMFSLISKVIWLFFQRIIFLIFQQLSIIKRYKLQQNTRFRKNLPFYSFAFAHSQTEILLGMRVKEIFSESSMIIQFCFFNGAKSLPWKWITDILNINHIEFSKFWDIWYKCFGISFEKIISSIGTLTLLPRERLLEGENRGWKSLN